MTRKEAREKAMQLIFQMEAQKQLNLEEGKLLVEKLEDLSKKDYMMEVIGAVVEHQMEIDSFIEEHSKWNISRMPKVELSILRLAVSEIKYCNLPKEVAINEAVELTKAYGEGSKYVNAILAKL